MSSAAVATEVDALAVRAEQTAQRVKRNARQIIAQLGWQDNYRRLFCDQDGALKPEAKLVLADLARKANFGVVSPGCSEADLRENEGSRRMLLHIFGRIDLNGDRLSNLAQTLREK